MQRDLKTEIDDDMELGPPQGTLIEQERDLESIPERKSREPETAEEPAGPDQTLPSSASGQGLSSERTNVVPKEEKPTSVPVSFIITL